MNLTFIPTALVALRILIAPLLLLDAFDGQTSNWFIIGFVTAFLSDIFDGVIARRLNASNPQLRQADGWADNILYICILASVWLTHPNIFVIYRIPLLSLLVAQLLWWVVNLSKYKRPASYHGYSAKFWGLTLFAAIIAIFGYDYAGVILWFSCIAGVIHSIEEIAMTLILPVWQHDVLSIFHALKLRDELKASTIILLNKYN
jgi:phosphatidylglycerophosphate synthase